MLREANQEKISFPLAVLEFCTNLVVLEILTLQNEKRDCLLLLVGSLGSLLGLLTVTLLDNIVSSASLVSLLSGPVLFLLCFVIRSHRSDVSGPPSHQGGTNSGSFQVVARTASHKRVLRDMVKDEGRGGFGRQ